MDGVLPVPVVAAEAIVLRAWPTGESGVVASLLTDRHGFVRVLARGARRRRTTLGPLVQPGRVVAVEHTWHPGRELQFLRGGEVVADLLAGTGLEQAAYLQAALELVDRCHEGGEQRQELFRLCRRQLPVLSSTARERAAAAFYRFELSLLAVQGVAPSLARCIVCGGEVPQEADTVGFLPAQGGIVCPACRRRTDAAERSLDGEAWRRLRELAAREGELPILERRLRREIGVLLHHLLGRHLPGYRLPAALELLRPRYRPGPVSRRRSTEEGSTA